MNSESTLANEVAADLAVVLADTEFITAHRYSEWAMLGAPDIEEDIALSSIIQDELGHARSAYKAAATLNDTTTDDLLYERSVDEWRNPAILDDRLGNWAEIIASLAVLDYATVFVYENLQDGSCDELANIAEKVLQEESQHIQHGRTWFSVFSDESQDEYSKSALQNAINRFVPSVAQWLGHDEGSEELLESSTFVRSNEAMREEFIADVEELVESNGFEMPTLSLEWDEWDTAMRRPAPPTTDFESTVDKATGREHRYLSG